MASEPRPTAQSYSAQERAAIYRAIDERRDMRHFAGGSVAPEVLTRLLTAAHHGVGFSGSHPRAQPRPARAPLRCVYSRWSASPRPRRRRSAAMPLELKVEGLLDAAEVFAVALADGREAHVFGRRTLPEMDLASVACAIQNLWLAARAEGLGMGWVSIFDPADVAHLRQLRGRASASPVGAVRREPCSRERWARRRAARCTVV